MEFHCNVCGARSTPLEQAKVRCNVRRFREETFTVWRCAGCKSLHALEDVDLDHYYAGYPVFAAQLDWKLDVVYRNMLHRLQRAGLQKTDAVLDYGCASGLLVNYLQKRGYSGAVGYDRYAAGHNNPATLERTFDAIICQDVIEHVDSPRELLSDFIGRVRPGGFIAIGTPDAEALDLHAPEDFVHALHQPYHRHILASSALKQLGQDLGLEVVTYYSTMFNNTLVPTMNPRFALHYVRCHDDVYDLVSEPIRLDSWQLWSPKTLFLALFGYFFDRHTDIMVVFRKPQSDA